MAVLARDIGQSLAGVRNSLSSWDSCMAKSYCKWPVVAAIVLGSLVVLSVLFCAFRCLCCGVECCCGCLRCCNACCPSPRRRDKGYQQAPPTPYQYQQPAPMQHPHFASGGGGGGGYSGARSVAQTATFESPSQKYHEDALPAMPSWSNASSKRVEQYDDDVELSKMETRIAPSAIAPPAQKERLLVQNPNDHSGQEIGSATDLGYRGQEAGSTGDIGAGYAHVHAQPYQDYDQQRQQITSPYGSQRGATGYYTGAQVDEHSRHHRAQNYYNNNTADSYATSGYDRNPTAPAAYRSPMSAGHHPAGSTSPVSYTPTNTDYYSGAQAQAPSYAQPKSYENSTSPPSYRSEFSPPGVLTPGGGVEGAGPS